MSMQPEFAELLDQQQQDRRQLLLASARLDEQRGTIEHLQGTIASTNAAHEQERAQIRSSHAEERAAMRAHHAAELAEVQASHAAELAATRAHHAAEVAALEAWRDAMMRSRTYRLMQILDRLYQTPVLGWALKLVRRAILVTRGWLKPRPEK